MRENRTSGSMRRGEKRVMVHSANGHRTQKGGNGGAPPDLYTTALALHSTEDTRSTPRAAAIDAGAIVRALDMPTRRGFAQAARDWQSSALRNHGAVGLDIETSPGGAPA
jgi:hypothetical protein